MSVAQLLQVPLPQESTLESVEWTNIVTKFKDAPGNQGVFHAAQHEDPSIAGLVVVFASPDAHAEWAASPGHDAVQAELRALATGPVYDNTVRFTTADLAPALTAPAVELVSWVYPSAGVDAAKQQAVLDSFRQFRDAIVTTPEAAGDTVFGWSQASFDNSGVDSKRFTSFIGWKSVEEHYSCKKTAPFLDNIPGVMQHGHTNIEMVHFAYQKA